MGPRECVTLLRNVSVLQPADPEILESLQIIPGWSGVSFIFHHTKQHKLIRTGTNMNDILLPLKTKPTEAIVFFVFPWVATEAKQSMMSSLAESRLFAFAMFVNFTVRTSASEQRFMKSLDERLFDCQPLTPVYPVRKKCLVPKKWLNKWLNFNANERAQFDKWLTSRVLSIVL